MRHSYDFRLAAAALVTVALHMPAVSHAQKAQPAAPAPAPSPAVPQQTTASFADWTLRCTRTNPAAPACEVVQTINSQERPVAQIAFGRTAKGQPMHLTILVPASVSFGASPTLATGRDGDPATVELGWRRCLPGGCMAEATVPDDTLRRIRGWTEAGRISFADGVGRPATLPFSAKGLSQALDALGKEEAG